MLLPLALATTVRYSGPAISFAILGASAKWTLRNAFREEKWKVDLAAS